MLYMQINVNQFFKTTLKSLNLVELHEAPDLAKNNCIFITMLKDISYQVQRTFGFMQISLVVLNISTPL